MTAHTHTQTTTARRDGRILKRFKLYAWMALASFPYIFQKNGAFIRIKAVLFDFASYCLGWRRIRFLKTILLCTYLVSVDGACGAGVSGVSYCPHAKTTLYRSSISSHRHRRGRCTGFRLILSITVQPTDTKDKDV